MTHIVQSEILAFMAGFIYLACTLFVFYVAHKRAKFSFILFVYEYFFIIGLGFGSIALAFGYGATDDFFDEYIFSNGPIRDFAFWHLISYAVGMALGMATYKPSSFNRQFFNQVEAGSVLTDLFSYRAFLFMGIGFLLIYVSIAGPQVAFTSAASARAGSTEGLESVSSFVFFKNIAQIGTLSLIFFPAILCQKSKGFNIGLLFIYGILLYFLTGARAAISDTIMFALVIYISRNKLGFRQLVFVFACSIFGLLFTLYGKGLGDDLFSLIFDVSSNIVLRDSSFELFLGQFSHLIFSIDAGIINFEKDGPYISKAILLAPLGFMPGWLFNDLGLEGLSWQNVDFVDNIVCLNTMAYPLAYPCTIPPYFVGVAAYIWPVVFGFVFGFAKFYAISIFSVAWKEYKSHPNLLWKPLLAIVLLERLTLFIPNVIGLFSFIGILVLILYYLRKFIVGVKAFS